MRGLDRFHASADARPLDNDRSNERLAMLGEIHSYRQMLDVLLRRSAEHEARFGATLAPEAAAGIGTPEFDRERFFAVIAERTEAGLLLRLDIESFYVFARILLDRLAQLVAWTIDGHRGFDRSSEVNFSKLATGALTRGLTQPLFDEPTANLLTRADETISWFRNQRVIHEGRVRRLTGFSYTTSPETGEILEVRLDSGTVMDHERDHLHAHSLEAPFASEPLPDLLELVDTVGEAVLVALADMPRWPGVEPEAAAGAGGLT